MVADVGSWISIVRVEDLDSGTRVAVRELHAPRSGTIVIELSIEQRAKAHLAREVLRALGKQPGLMAGDGDRDTVWMDRALAWLIGEQITDLVVLRANLTVAPWDKLFEFAAAARLRLWLICDGPALPRRARERSEAYGLSERSIDQMLRALRAACDDPPSVAVDVPPSFPRVSTFDFPLFLADAYAQLTSDDFAVVEAAFDRTACAARDWLDAQPDEVTEASLATWLRDELADCRTQHELVTRVRGAQTALWWSGWDVAVRPQMLASPSRFTVQLDDELCEQLRGYSNPLRPALAILAVMTSDSPGIVCDTNIGDLATDGSEICVGGRTHPIPPAARGILRAQRAAQLHLGARGEDPLFAPLEEPHRRYHWHKAQIAMRHVSQDIGLRLTEHWSRQRNEGDMVWWRRHGIRLRRFPDD